MANHLRLTAEAIAIGLAMLPLLLIRNLTLPISNALSLAEFLFGGT